MLDGLIMNSAGESNGAVVVGVGNSGTGYGGALLKDQFWLN